MGALTDTTNLNQLIASSTKGCFQLPTAEGKKVFYVVPLSGGIDSFATGYVLNAMFPHINFIYVNADTGVEVDGTEQALERFEQITGKSIYRIKPKRDLFTMIEGQGNFLPSQRQRSCTQAMKTTPISQFFKAMRARFGEDIVVFQFVGIRADEPYRTGIEWKEPWLASVHPLANLGLVKRDVNLIVEMAQGIPSYYSYKSRSGCAVCIFSRRQEILAAWQRNPKTLARAANMENVPAAVMKIYNALPRRVSELLKVGRNYINYYRPSWLNNPKSACEAPRKKTKAKNSSPMTMDMFSNESKSLFVAVEYHYEDNRFGMLSGPMVYFEDIINYSTTMAGLKNSLKFFWIHRLHTKEMHGLDTEDELRGERRIAIFQIEVDYFDQEIPPKPESVYTWQNDKTPLYAIRKTLQVIEHILLCAGINQGRNSKDRHWATRATEHEKTLRCQRQYGRILHVSEYIPQRESDLIEDADVVDEPAPCLACSR